MPTASTPAIASPAANAAAQLLPEPTSTGKARAQQVAACLGICCPKRAHCVHYSEVERPEQPRAVRSCRTPEGAFPLFVDRRAPVRVWSSDEADSEGGEI